MIRLRYGRVPLPRILQNVRERLVLVLIAVLPFHALLVTVLTKFFAGAGHAPLPILALWKEGVLALILALCCVEMMREDRRWKMEDGRQLLATSHFPFPTFDILDACTLVLMFIAVLPLITTFSHPTPTWLLGFKYDFLLLGIFPCVRRVPWSDTFRTRVIRILLVDAVLVGIFAVVSSVVPQVFFTFLGYSDLHSLYLPDGPIAAFQQIESIALRRVQSTFSGPNQLALWLLLPYAAYLASKPEFPHKVGATFLVLIGLTFSRAALLAFFCMTVMNFFLVYSRKEAWIRVSILSAFLALPLGLAIAKSPDLLLRATSTRGHWDRPLEAIQTIIQHPLGLGLGSAGPASNRVSDACVFLEAESDASWARDRGELCVFVGGTQMQPLNRTCRCPLLPENWYLQIGVELGVLGFLLYLTLTIMIFRALLSIVRSGVHPSPLLHAAFLAFFGISIAALFLHAWEDSALAYSLWMLVGMALPAHRQNLSTA